MAPPATDRSATDLTPARSWLAVAAAMFGVGWGANQFSSLLLAYHQHRHLSVSTDQALLGIYALGLIPALLLGGRASDRWGRGRLVRPAAVLSVLATVILIVGARWTVALYVGRFLAGVVSGTAFAAGTAWVKELSTAPYDPAAGEQAGARRAAIALSAGFGLGPVAAGLLAQWAPAPLVVAYLPHLVVMAAVLPGLWRIPETVPRPAAGTPTPRLRARITVPAPSRRRFVGVVVPTAPWVFAAPAVAFAVLPVVIARQVSGFGSAFAGLTAGLTLGVGVAVQPLGRRLDRADGARGTKAGLIAVVVGLFIASLAAFTASIPLVVLAAAVLGSGYGLTLVAGLLEVQRLAGPDELAGLTAVYYALTYLGFAVPLVLAELRPLASYPELLLILGALAATTLLIVSARSGRPQRSAAI